MKTGDISKALQSARDIDAFVAEHEADFLDMPLHTHLAMLLEQKQRTRAEVIARAGLDTVYGYQIFSGRKQPSRDKVIRLALALSLTPDEAQQLLCVAHQGTLYVRRRRDALLLHALLQGLDIHAANDLLDRHGEALL